MKQTLKHKFENDLESIWFVTNTMILLNQQII